MEIYNNNFNNNIKNFILCVNYYLMLFKDIKYV